MTRTYNIEIEKPALKSLKKLDKPVRTRVVDAINGLATSPRPSGVKALVGSGFLRIRVGDYRIIYEVHDDRLVVVVIELGHRSDIYRDL